MLLVFGQAYLSGFSVLIKDKNDFRAENGQLRNVKFAVVGVRSGDGLCQKLGWLVLANTYHPYLSHHTHVLGSISV